jgi:hypothetical protein
MSEQDRRESDLSSITTGGANVTGPEKTIVFTVHARARMRERGAREEDVREETADENDVRQRRGRSLHPPL